MLCYSFQSHEYKKDRQHNFASFSWLLKFLSWIYLLVKLVCHSQLGELTMLLVVSIHKLYANSNNPPICENFLLINELVLYKEFNAPKWIISDSDQLNIVTNSSSFYLSIKIDSYCIILSSVFITRILRYTIAHALNMFVLGTALNPSSPCSILRERAKAN